MCDNVHVCLRKVYKVRSFTVLNICIPTSWISPMAGYFWIISPGINKRTLYSTLS